MDRDYLKIPIQNIPIRTKIGREIRAMFAPPPGSVFLNLDYSAAELQILEKLKKCGEPTT